MGDSLVGSFDDVGGSAGNFKGDHRWEQSLSAMLSPNSVNGVTACGMLASFFGLSGPVLTAEETAFFKAADPCGFILFKRNIENRAQLRALADSLRALSGREDLPILIDQEGGRVQRMTTPEWQAFPAMSAFDRLYATAPMSAIEAARVNARALALSLAEVGITVDCLPVLDVLQPGATEIVGDRSLGSDPVQVAALGKAVIDGLRQGGVVGVVKHMPGHGRALVDSHHALPRVSADEAALETDLAPFRSLSNAPMGMMAHIVYDVWDDHLPASQSPAVIERIVRQRIGFDGFLMSDDLDMKALSGSTGERAAACVAAGCDAALDCWARLPDMEDIANRVPAMTPRAVERLNAAMATIADQAIELAAYDDLIAKRDALLAYAV
jgi:beta-N-acetylhexosaminidase